MFKLFSRRRESKLPPKLQYDALPKEFRMQVVHILDAVAPSDAEPLRKYKDNIISSYDPSTLAPSGLFWQKAFRTLVKEFGKQTLVQNEAINTERLQCLNFILVSSAHECLDAIDLLFQRIDTDIREYPFLYVEVTPDAAISELNDRFKQHNIGFAFIHELVRVDSDLIYQEAVRPAFELLRDNDFAGAEQELFEAYKHLRSKRNKEAVVAANKAFESTLKTICNRKKWNYEKSATAKPLINLVLQKGLVPKYLEGHFHSLQTLLESGIPVVRNKTAGHGQGEEIVEIPDHVAVFALNITAANIVFLVENYQQRK